MKNLIFFDLSSMVILENLPKFCYTSFGYTFEFLVIFVISLFVILTFTGITKNKYNKKYGSITKKMEVFITKKTIEFDDEFSKKNEIPPLLRRSWSPEPSMFNSHLKILEFPFLTLHELNASSNKF